MEYRDYFQRHIDQLGKVLAAMLSEMTGLGHGNAALSIEERKQQLSDETNLNLDEVLSMDDSQILQHLKEELKYSNSSFEQLAELILLCYTGNARKRALEVSLILLEDKLKDSTDFQMNLSVQIDSIKKELDSFH